MHPGDCNAVLETHEFSQHFRARDHRNVLSTCSLDLGIVPCNRRTGHYNFRAGDVLYSVSDEDDGSKTGETRIYNVPTGNFYIDANTTCRWSVMIRPALAMACARARH